MSKKITLLCIISAIVFMVFSSSITFAVTVTFMGDGASEVEVTDQQANELLPAPSAKTGYDFVGWYTTPTFDDASKVTTWGDLNQNQDIKLYPKWKAKIYNLTFILDGGTMSVLGMQVEYDNTYGHITPLPTPTRLGYDFAGWFIGDTLITNDTKVQYPGNLALTAHWTPKKFQALFNGNGAENALLPIEVYYDKAYGELPTPTRTGHNFLGWFIGENKIEETTIFKGLDNVTLTAAWDPVETTLTIDPNGGEYDGNTSSTTITKTYLEYVNLSEPTPPEGVYKAHFVNNGVTTTIVQEREFSKWIKQEGTEQSDFTASVYVFGENDVTLTAQYDEVEITIPSEGTREGYEFDGWYSTDIPENQNNSTKLNEMEILSQDKTYYAKWNRVKTTLTIDPQDGTWKENATATPISIPTGYDGLYEDTKIIADPLPLNGQYKVVLDDLNPITVNQEIYQPRAFEKWTISDGTNETDFTGTVYTYGVVNKTLTAHYVDTQITLPGLSNITGYTFGGWYSTSVEEDQTDLTKVTTIDSLTGDRTVYAKWNPVKTTLTLDPNTGKYEGSSIAVEIPGYYKSKIDVKDATPTVGQYKVTLDDMIDTTDNEVIYQPRAFEKWTKSDGSDFTGTIYTYGIANETLTAHYVDTTITLQPLENITGYNFAGWYSTNIVADQTDLTKVTTIDSLTGDRTVYAKWDPVVTTLKLDPNGGTINNSTNVVELPGKYNTNVTVNEPTPPVGTYKIVLDDLDATTQNSEIVLPKKFEKWTLSNGSDFEGTTYTYGVADETLTAHYVDAEVILPALEDITGYKFVGWYNTPVEENQTDENKVTTIDSLTGDRTVYAKWDPVETTLTINPNGGKYGNSREIIAIPGYYNSKVKINNPVDGRGQYKVTLNYMDDTTPNEEIYQPQEFVKWTKLDGSDFTGTIYTYGISNETLTAQYVDTTLTLPILPDKTGITFAGWYNTPVRADQVETNKVTEFDSLTQDEIVYAKWISDETTLTINPNGGTWEDETEYKGLYGETKMVDAPIAPEGHKIRFYSYTGELKEEITQTISFTGWTSSVPENWDANTNTYTFGTDDATLEANYSGAAVTMPTDLQRDGYTFKGWYDADGNLFEGTITYIFTADVDLTEKWEINQSTLTVNPNGGTWNNDTNIQIIKCDYGTEVAIADPEAPLGYTVKFNSNGGETIEDITQIFTFTGWTSSIETNWNAETKVYTYGDDDATLTANYSVSSIELPELKMTGSNFLGWYDADDNLYEGTITDALEADLELTAKWEVKKSYLSVDPAGGVWNTLSTVQKIQNEYGTQIVINDPTSNPTGYTITFDTNGADPIDAITQTFTFTGWTSSIEDAWNAETKIYTFGEEDATLTANYEADQIILPVPSRGDEWVFAGWYYGDTKLESNVVTNLTDNVTLVAHWNPAESTVTIDPNGGIWAGFDTPTSYTNNYGSEVEVTDPVVPNAHKIKLIIDEENSYEFIYQEYEFLGWESTLEEAWNAETSIYTFISDATLTATYGVKEVTLPIPDIEGYEFLGWYDADDNLYEGTITDDLQGDLELTAKLKLKDIKLAIDPNVYGIWNGTPDLSEITQKYGTYMVIEDAIGYISNITVNFDSNEGNSIDSIVPMMKFIGWTTDVEKSWNEKTKTYTFYENGTLTANYELEKVILPNVKRNGFKLTGWYTQDGEFVGKAYDLYVPTQETITLVAGWEEVKEEPGKPTHVSSEWYDIEEITDVDAKDYGTKYINKIETGTTVERLWFNIESNATEIKVIDENGNVLGKDDLVGTGMTIIISKEDGKSPIIFTAVVMGDVDGDGKHTIQDLSELNKAYLGISRQPLEGARFRAVDLDGNNKLTATDLSELNKAILQITHLKNTRMYLR